MSNNHLVFIVKQAISLI